VQGAGGVATALITLASAPACACGSPAARRRSAPQALALGADQAFEPGARLSERVDAVMETTGAATWGHSIRSLKPGGVLVISGATTGDASARRADRIFFLQLSVVGSTMGTRDELERLIRFCVDRGVRPQIDRTLPLSDARAGFERMLAGDLQGKIVFTVD
jgi:D-arabinose 1-dehydrogenase-like Zn-dependent alcohol dehydrogenase